MYYNSSKSFSTYLFRIQEQMDYCGDDDALVLQRISRQQRNHIQQEQTVVGFHNWHVVDDNVAVLPRISRRQRDKFQRELLEIQSLAMDYLIGDDDDG